LPEVVEESLWLVRKMRKKESDELKIKLKGEFETYAVP
jgi:hypothetical protein